MLRDSLYRDEQSAMIGRGSVMNQSKGKASPKTSQRKSSQAKAPKQSSQQGQRRTQAPRQFKQPVFQQLKQVAAAYSEGISQTEPQITRGKDWIRIKHKELVANVTGSVGFTVANSLPLQPGLSTFCKWLAIQSIGWETYEWNDIEARALTRTGSNTPGSLALIPDYDAADAAPTDEFSASADKDLAEDVPWKTICCKMPHSRLHPEGKRKFLRFGAVASTDIKTYDAGNLFVTTTDGTAVPWSKLWIYYDVTLYTPQLPPGGVVAMSNELHIVGGAFTSANAFANQTVGVGSNTGMATVPATGEIITFNVPGRYLVVYNTISTSVTQTGMPALSTGSTFVSTYFPSSAGFNGGLGYAGGGAASTSQYMVVTMAAAGTITYNNTVVGGTGYDLTITAINTLAA